MSSDPFDLADDIRYDRETGTYRASFDCARVRPSTAIVSVMADVRDTETTQFTPLHDVIDADALDRLCRAQASRRRGGDVMAAFDYLDYRVRVGSHGVLELRPQSAGDGVGTD